MYEPIIEIKHEINPHSNTIYSDTIFVSCEARKPIQTTYGLFVPQVGSTLSGKSYMGTTRPKIIDLAFTFMQDRKAKSAATLINVPYEHSRLYDSDISDLVRQFAYPCSPAFDAFLFSKDDIKTLFDPLVQFSYERVMEYAKQSKIWHR
jgi:hypothetical protein